MCIKVNVNQNGFELSGTYQYLSSTDDVNLLGENILHTVKENTEALFIPSKETGLEVNAEATATHLCPVKKMRENITP
jgi:hypothetical protein